MAPPPKIRKNPSTTVNNNTFYTSQGAKQAAVVSTAETEITPSIYNSPNNTADSSDFNDDYNAFKENETDWEVDIEGVNAYERMPSSISHAIQQERQRAGSTASPAIDISPADNGGLYMSEAAPTTYSFGDSTSAQSPTTSESASCFSATPSNSKPSRSFQRNTPVLGSGSSLFDKKDDPFAKPVFGDTDRKDDPSSKPTFGTSSHDQKQDDFWASLNKYK